MSRIYKFNDLSDLVSHRLENDEVDFGLDPVFIDTFKGRSKHFLPQLLAQISNFSLRRTHKTSSHASRVGEPETLSLAEVLKDNCKDNPANMVLLQLCKYSSRGDLLDVPQYKPEAAPYCALVPLFLAAFKKYRNIDYSSWKKDELKYVVHTRLLEAMMYVPPELTNKEILELREQGLAVKSGPRAGTSRNPQTASNMYHMKGTALEEAPPLALSMITQTWCAHPVNRNKYMILDCVNYDLMPEPLIETEVIIPKQETSKPTRQLEPWET